MSFPTKDVVFGTVIYRDKKYDSVSSLTDTNKEYHKKLQQYKKENQCGISTAPWSSNKTTWVVEDKKLYLVDMRINSIFCKIEHNIIQDIFQTDKLFASWLNKDIKLLISKKKIERTEDSKDNVQRDVLVLSFKNGMIVDTKQITEQYFSYLYL